MRLLLVHADRFAFEAAAGAGDGPAENEDVPREAQTEDCVAAFVTVERGDAADPDAVVANAAAELRDATDRLNARKLALYPTVHLSDAPASADTAATVLRDLASELDADRAVLRAPLSSHTAFEIAAKGHPFSTRSRRVTPESAADGATGDRPPSEWRLAFPGGDAVTLPESDSLNALDDGYADRVSDDLRALVAREIGGESVDRDRRETADSDGRPAREALVREQRLAADVQPADDGRDGTGALRWLPRGTLVRDALTEYATDLALDRGAMPVETATTGSPDARQPGERAESVDGHRNRDRSSASGPSPPCAACADHFALVRGADLDTSELPVALYELSTDADPSLPDARRTGSDGDATHPTHRPKPTVPVVHTATADLAQAKEELATQVDTALRAGEDLGLTCTPVIRTTRAFHDENEAWVESLVDDLGAPALVELRPERRDGRELRVDFATTDGPGRPIYTAAVALDVESAERFGVTCDAGDETRHPPLLHFSPIGSVEDALAALLGAAAERELPRLPTWLSPTQVRLVPVDETHVEHCDALAATLESSGIRVDVDDRDEPVGERLARAADDWVPYCAVVGDRETERDAGTLKVTVRAEGVERELTPDELEAAVLADVGDRPTTARSLPRRLTRRPDLANH
ncbi:threonyl-tRNA synthetase editing domain-containing protein [Halorussus sp. AFM4]|uniref:threonyl-tRNA synthetase editing domain-containing protein n=1 Tax=Halorussus sp. AFM4 TaxID=3421651 RepID=UPI003EB95088